MVRRPDAGRAGGVMWWWLVIVLAVIVAAVVVLQRRGNTGVAGYEPRDKHGGGYAGGNVPPGTDGGAGGF
ncbi:hypothetical protein [Phycicoccus sonneratiae]|uniref:Uncharacterized protein n=1 Tax=Phycicoccus sonneratiae TaxID=2807628 RepID=A0ABS2CPE1_9MICO|nr:hypothetical protein [Phycicoccus sonneraticus]MBM6401751.1 hypothetical protein [Phycicoccus sonneraticus]